MAAARDEIVSLFTQDLGYTHVSDLGLNPTSNQLITLLRTFCRHKDRRPDDLVAVYIGGHGEVLDATHDHVLLTADTDPDDVADALQTAQLARKMLLNTRVRRVLLMLDTCYSGHGGDEFTAAAITAMIRNWGEERGSGLAVITSAQPSEQAQTGAFPQLLRAAVHSLPTAGYNPDTLPLGSVVEAMNSSKDKPGYQTIGSSVAALTGDTPPFLPNPRHDPRMTEVDLAIQHASEWDAYAERRDIEFRSRLLVRAMGGHDAQGWWFAGRHTALLDIASWLRHPDPHSPLLAVTGDPGSGKTAVLGLIASLAHSTWRTTVPLSTLGLPAAAVPAPSAVDVVIYAQGLTTDEVLKGIAAAARLHANTPGELLDGLSGTGAPLTVLLDAVDEAVDPDHLTRNLLRHLVEHAAGRLRLLIGTRPYLLDRLGRQRDDAVDLDSDRYADLDALTTYAARGLLESNPYSPYRVQPHRVRAVAEAVAAAASPSFLVVRITSATLAAQSDIADPRDPAWLRDLPRLPSDAMRRDLETRLGSNATTVRDLLRPLAFAEGQGLPWEDIWAAVATRAADTTYTDDDLFWLRQHAGSYFVEAAEAGRSTYRLYHQALAEHLRSDVDATTMHRAIAEVLQNRVPRTLDGRCDWARAHPYTLRHLAAHAAYAGVLDRLIADTGYLVHADPGPLLHALHQTASDNAAITAAIYRCSADIHRTLPPLRRQQVLAIDAARFRASDLHQDLSAGLAWPPRWATGLQTTPALRTTFSGSEGALACSVLDGRPVAITNGRGGAVQVWDLATAERITTYSGHTRRVVAVACSVLDDRPVAISTSQDGTAQVWDLATARQINCFSHRTNQVSAVACSVLDDRPVAVTTGHDGAARVWDLATANELSCVTGHAGRVSAVACSVLNGRPVAITTSYDGTAWVWDLATSESVAVYTGHIKPVVAVACSVLDDRPVAITTSQDGTAQVWDLATAKQINWFSGRTETVVAVACSVLHDRPVAITSSCEGVARVWDLATAEHITTYTGHTSEVVAVTSSVLDNRPVVVTSSKDGTTRVWRSLPSAFKLPAFTGHSAKISAAAYGVLGRRPVVVTGSADSTVRVWDSATAEHIATYTGHTKPVVAVACSVLHDRPVAITSSGERVARVWDLATAEHITTYTGHTSEVVAVTSSVLDNRPVAITSSNEGVARVWDLATAEHIATYTGHTRRVDAVACSVLDGRVVAITASSDKTVQVWDLATAEHIATYTGHTKPVVAVACSVLDNRPVVVTTSKDRTAQVWDLATAEHITTYAGHARWVTAVGCSVFDNRRVAITTSHDDTARVWDLANAKEINIFDLRDTQCLAVGPGGELVIATGWDLVVLDRAAKH
ncbi:caspase family protein [Amycolatopsis sp. NPDC052450]|uniref:caspase family protein n=1 Tax=Amycolatopsis sp. NPDC052450 TaxID=3363937 RepID=UPI0037CB37AA